MNLEHASESHSHGTVEPSTSAFTPQTRRPVILLSFDSPIKDAQTLSHNATKYGMTPTLTPPLTPTCIGVRILAEILALRKFY
jgi:hypothetical protein